VLLCYCAKRQFVLSPEAISKPNFVRIQLT